MGILEGAFRIRLSKPYSGDSWTYFHGYGRNNYRLVPRSGRSRIFRNTIEPDKPYKNAKLVHDKGPHAAFQRSRRKGRKRELSEDTYGRFKIRDRLSNAGTGERMFPRAAFYRKVDWCGIR